MASPQAENGHTDIANELLEALCRFRMPGECRQVFDCVMRKTYGFHKSEDRIALSQIVEMTGLSQPNVSRAMAKLCENRLLIKTDIKTFRINKDYSGWVPFGSEKHIKSDIKENISKVIYGHIKSDIKNISKVRDTKEKKENIQKKERGQAPRHPAETMDECREFLRYFNEQRHTGYASISAILDNFSFWRQSYSLDDILKAVRGSKRSDYWKDRSLTPTILLRQKNPQGEKVDNIADFMQLDVPLKAVSSPSPLVEHPPDVDPAVAAERMARIRENLAAKFAAR